MPRIVVTEVYEATIALVAGGGGSSVVVIVGKPLLFGCERRGGLIDHPIEDAA